MAATAESGRTAQSRFEVRFDQQLPDMETLGGAAYACVDTRDASNAVYAVIPKDGAAFRHRVLHTLLGRATPHIVCPVEITPVEIEDGGWVQAIIAPYPTGGRLYTPQSARRFSESELRSNVLPDVIAGLQALDIHELAHRSLRPDHIHYLDSSRSGVTLGECFSELPGQSQPMVFEPMERALAHPAGRGEGDSRDDMFALGVTILTLLGGQVPCAGMSDHDIVNSRVTRGSYNTYVKEVAPRGAFGALLRGLLCDEASERWTLDKVHEWLDGTMPGEPRSVQNYIVASHYRFQNRNYTNRRLLAQALHDNFEAAMNELALPAFQNWVRIAVKDETGSAVAEKVFDSGGTRAPDRANQRLHGGTLSRVIQLLDHEGPVRFRSLSYMLDGLSGLVAHAMTTGNADLVRDLGDFFGHGYARDVSVLAAGTSPPLRRIAMEQSEIERQVSTSGLGGGLVLALYYLNPAMLCQSPLFERWHVANIPQMLVALDALAAERPDRDVLVDDHIAAFCSNHWSDSVGLIAELSRAESRPVDKMIATLKFYAFAQAHFDVGPLPGLAQHFAGKMKAAVKTMNHGRTVEFLLTRIEKITPTGNLLRLHDGVNFYAVRARDRDRYSAAKAELAYITSKLSSVQRGYKPTDFAATDLGQRIAVGGAFLTLLMTALLIFRPGF